MESKTGFFDRGSIEFSEMSAAILGLFRKTFALQVEEPHNSRPVATQTFLEFSPRKLGK